ncbi:Hypothetical protein GLP15_731 [Giardia lamblia P15]|uniref:Uncharacterized protein n=1 Tax=Giardia intestinalis (strain P15) TaxID=658858 RepID=E1F403_GIAIA|nr:Hypothetical protein GLP15_731 [Giardia lamblia P15]
MLRLWQEYVQEDDVLACLSVLDEDCQRAVQVIERLDVEGGTPEMQTHERVCSSFYHGLVHTALRRFPLTLSKNLGRVQGISNAFNYALQETSTESFSHAISSSCGSLVSSLCNNPSVGAATGALPNLRKSPGAALSALLMGPTIAHLVGSIYSLGLSAYHICRLELRDLHLHRVETNKKS